MLWNYLFNEFIFYPPTKSPQRRLPTLYGLFLLCSELYDLLSSFSLLIHQLRYMCACIIFCAHLVSYCTSSRLTCLKFRFSFTNFQLLRNNLNILVLDASSKLQSGILSGNTGELGSYHQCLDVKGFTAYGSIFGKFCTVDIIPGPKLSRQILTLKNISSDVRTGLIPLPIFYLFDSVFLEL